MEEPKVISICRAWVNVGVTNLEQEYWKKIIDFQSQGVK